MFIKKWCPELEKLPIEYLHQPWRQTPMEALFNDFKIGEDYPTPIIHLRQASIAAKDRLWQYRERKDVQKAIPAIIKRHVNVSATKN